MTVICQQFAPILMVLLNVLVKRDTPAMESHVMVCSFFYLFVSIVQVVRSLHLYRIPWHLSILNRTRSLHTSLVAHQAGAYPGFRSMTRLGVFLLRPGWDASLLQGYPQQ